MLNFILRELENLNSIEYFECLKKTECNVALWQHLNMQKNLIRSAMYKNNLNV